MTAQTQQIESLKQLLKTESEDTNKVNTLNDLVWYFNDASMFDEAIKYGNQSQQLARKISFTHGLINALSYIGYSYQYKGDYTSAMSCFVEEQKIYQTYPNAKGLATNQTNIGNVNADKGNYPLAIENYYKALKTFEALKNKEGIATTYNNLGIVFSYQNNLPKTLEYFLKALKINEDLGRKKGIVNSLGNIGNVFYSMHNYSKAIQYQLKALKLNNAIGNKSGLSDNYGNISIIYNDQDDSDFVNQNLKPSNRYTLTMQYAQKALEINEEIGSKYGIVVNLTNIGSCYLKQTNYAKAIEYFTKSLNIAKEDGFPEMVKEAAQKLSIIYEINKNDKQALVYYKAFIAARDSLTNEENTKKTVQMEMNYEFDKKEASAKLEQEKKDVIAFEESRKQKIVIIGISVVLVLILLLSVVIFRSLRINQKKNRIIQMQKEAVQHQKELVEEKHKEITDSINYAERIQRSLLASADLLNENLKEYFIFFQPKDVVSGDFYWAAKLSNGNFALLTADSTGHGVPGAIMSILNISCIEKSIEAEKLLEPVTILNHTRSKIITTLKKDGSTEGGKDGMDCSLISFDLKHSKLTYAAANNPILLIRGGEILEFPFDKMPVGKHDKDTTSFTHHTIELQKGDMVYTLTDGISDQFGGSKGKKFMYKKLKELLVSIAHLSMQQQKETLANVLNTWKGNLEQVDDITLIGIRV